jgi:hypothetical protein
MVMLFAGAASGQENPGGKRPDQTPPADATTTPTVDRGSGDGSSGTAGPAPDSRPRQPDPNRDARLGSRERLAALELQRDQLAAQIQSLQDQIAQLRAEIARLKKGKRTKANRAALKEARDELKALQARLAAAQQSLDDLNSQIANLNHPEHRDDRAPKRRVRARIPVLGPCDAPSNPCNIKAPATFVPHPIPDPGMAIKNTTPVTVSPGLLESDVSGARPGPSATGTPTPNAAPNYSPGGGGIR